MKLTKENVPAYGDYDRGERIELLGGMTARVRVHHDTDLREPWIEHDIHGPVSDWRPRDSKAPGERVLCTDRGSARFYDWAQAVKMARADGWDAPPYGTGTKGEQAARAVEADFKRLQAWCNGEWHWIGVEVTLRDKAGAEVGIDSLWGIESDGDYWRETAAEIVEGLRAEYAKEQRAARAAKKAAAYTAYQTAAFIGCTCGAQP